MACWQFVLDPITHNGRPASVISLQQLTTFSAVLPAHMDKDFAASALLPNVSGLKSAAALNAAAAVRLWGLLKIVIFFHFGFAISLIVAPDLVQPDRAGFERGFHFSLISNPMPQWPRNSAKISKVPTL